MLQLRKSKFIHYFLAVFFLAFLYSPEITAQDKVKNIVVFFSFGSNLPAFENILGGLHNTIEERTDETVNIIPEYLDISRSENDEYSRFIINMYNKKLNDFKVDILMTVGPGVNDAILKYGNSALKGLKVINVDMDLPGRTTLADLNIKDGIEIILKFQVGKTLKEAFAMFPEYKDIFVISGSSRFDNYYTSLVMQNKHEFEPEYTFRFISNLTMDSTIRFVRTIPRNSIVVVPLFMKDAANTPFTTPEALDIISKYSPAPVFLPVTDAGVKTRGSIGGYLFSYNNLGKELGRISLEIMDGKPMKDITVNENSFYGHFYDWNELVRWNITDSKVIPAHSIFYNKPISFFDLYKWYILAVLIFLMSQTLLIIYLFRLNKRQKAIAARMEETEIMHRELIHTDRLSKMSTLTASLSHELFQPLSAIRITAQAGKRFVLTGKLDMNRASQMFDNILEDDLRATGIITSVKNLMKPESQKMETVDLHSLILETVDIIRSDAKKQNIRITINLEAGPVFVFGDKIQVQQVLMNFIRNAASAMEKCDPANRNLEINSASAGGSVTVSVCDSGPGVDNIIKEKLFKPFVTTRNDGFGIGLTLCRSIIEKHNGKIWVENLPEGGAKFSFSLQTIKNPTDE